MNSVFSAKKYVDPYFQRYAMAECLDCLTCVSEEKNLGKSYCSMDRK